jgi:LEA14-like dessication related protein
MLAIKRLLPLIIMLLLSACASWLPAYEKPQVNVTSFTVDPESTGVAPTFLIGLQVVNPNRRVLPLQGMSYSVDVEDQRVLTGAEPDLPQVPAYGTAEFTVRATPDLLGSARLLNQLLSGQRDSLHYRLTAKFDIGSLLPFVTLEEQGEFGFGQAADDTAY